MTAGQQQQACRAVEQTVMLAGIKSSTIPLSQKQTFITSASSLPSSLFEPLRNMDYNIIVI